MNMPAGVLLPDHERRKSNKNIFRRSFSRIDGTGMLCLFIPRKHKNVFPVFFFINKN